MTFILITSSSLRGTANRKIAKCLCATPAYDTFEWSFLLPMHQVLSMHSATAAEYTHINWELVLSDVPVQYFIQATCKEHALARE